MTQTTTITFPGTITLNAAMLRGCAQIAPKADIRHYLVGVLLHWNGRDTLTYVATDGHCLVALRETIPADDREPYGAKPWEIIIPREVAACAVPVTRHIVRLPMATQGAQYGLGLLKGGDALFSAVDGKFPDWRRVVPIDEPSGETAQFDPEILARTMHALRIGNDCDPKKNMLWHLEHNGNCPGRIVTPAGIGVIMPYRSECALEITADMRDWIRGYRLETAAVQEVPEAVAA